MIREVLIVVANFCFCSNQFVECCKISTGTIENDCNIHLEVRFPSQLVEVKQIVVLWLLFLRFSNKLSKTKSHSVIENKSVIRTIIYCNSGH